MLTYLCAVFYGFTTQWADPGPKFFLLNTWIYAAVLVASLLHVTLRRYGLYAYLYQRLASARAALRPGWTADYEPSPPSAAH